MRYITTLLALAGAITFTDFRSANADSLESSAPSSIVQNSAQKVGDVKKIFVGSLGTVSGSEMIRQKLINALSKSVGALVVDSAEKADAVLLGSAEISHHRTFTLGVGYVSSMPNYNADVVLRLEGKDHKSLWTDEISSRKHFSHLSGKGASSDVVAKIVSRLSEAINTNDGQIAAQKPIANHM